MDLFATDSEILQLRLQLPALVAAEQLQTKLAIAWHIRQRDTHGALALCQEIEAPALWSSLSRWEQTLCYFRLQLIRGEAKWLEADLEAATAIVGALLRHPDIDADGAILSDTHRLMALILSDQGRHVECDIQLAIAIDEASKAEDFLRAKYTAVALARIAVLRDSRVARAYFDRHIDLRREPVAANTGLSAVVYDFLGIYAGLSNRYEESRRDLGLAFEASLQTGQIRRAILVAANIGYTFNNMDDYPNALLWLQKSLALARATGWAPSIGNCLMQIGEILRKMGSLAAARETLEDAMQVLAPLTGSRNYALVVSCLADVAMDTKDYALALGFFRQLANLPGAQEQSDLQALAANGEAQALAHMSHTETIQVADATSSIHH
ncbi:MAG: hypothetical protein KGM99_06025 [Burkholderiales bacterium]|nr:hypothetical protein [Burkholderiales bacterium]